MKWVMVRIALVVNRDEEVVEVPGGGGVEWVDHGYWVKISL